MDPWVAIAGAGGTAPAGQGWNGPDLARGFVLPPEPSIGDLAGYDWSGPGGGSDGGEGSGDGSGGEDSEDAKETVVVRGTPEDNSPDGPVFHPMLDIGIVVGGGLPVDEVIIQRPPDVGDDGGSVDGGGGVRAWGTPWPAFYDEGMSWKDKQCCECLLSAESKVGGAGSEIQDDAVWVAWCRYQYITKPSDRRNPPNTDAYNRCIDQDTPAEKRNWCLSQDVCPKVRPVCQEKPTEP